MHYSSKKSFGKGSGRKGEPLGFVFAVANCIFFMPYVILGHQIAEDGGATGIDRLGAAMLVALIIVSPIGFRDVLPAFTQPVLLLAGIGVGICSSVIPYVCDQFAMARLPQATFALLLSTTCIRHHHWHRRPTPDPNAHRYRRHSTRCERGPTPERSRGTLQKGRATSSITF